MTDMTGHPSSTATLTNTVSGDSFCVPRRATFQKADTNQQIRQSIDDTWVEMVRVTIRVITHGPARWQDSPPVIPALEGKDGVPRANWLVRLAVLASSRFDSEMCLNEQVEK